jgi:hypothetical protein
VYHTTEIVVCEKAVALGQALNAGVFKQRLEHLLQMGVRENQALNGRAS